MKRLYVPLEMMVYQNARPVTCRAFYQVWLDERSWIRQTLVGLDPGPNSAITVQLECKSEPWTDWINLRVGLMDGAGCPIGLDLPALLYARPHAVPMVTVFPPYYDEHPYALTLRVVNETTVEDS